MRSSLYSAFSSWLRTRSYSRSRSRPPRSWSRTHSVLTLFTRGTVGVGAGATHILDLRVVEGATVMTRSETTEAGRGHQEIGRLHFPIHLFRPLPTNYVVHDARCMTDDPQLGQRFLLLPVRNTFETSKCMKHFILTCPAGSYRTSDGAVTNYPRGCKNSSELRKQHERRPPRAQRKLIHIVLRADHLWNDRQPGLFDKLDSSSNFSRKRRDPQ